MKQINMKLEGLMCLFLTVGIVVMMEMCPSVASLTRTCGQSELNNRNMDAATSYVDFMVKIVRALNWSNVIIINEKSEEMNITWSTKSDTSWRMVADDMFRPIPSSSTVGCFLVLGGNQFAWYLFHEVFLMYNNITHTNPLTPDNAQRRLSVMTSEWLAVGEVNDVDKWNDVLSPLEHVVVIDTAQQFQWSVWTSRQTGDNKELQQVVTLKPDYSTTCVQSLLSRLVLLPNLSQGLGGRTLRVVVKENVLMITKVKEGGIQGYEGALIDVLHQLSLTLNFSYILLDPPDKSWGEKIDKNRWDGPIGMLTRQEADLVIGPYRMTSERKQVVDYTTPYDFEYPLLVYKTDENDESNEVSFFLRPLQTTVFIALAVCLPCVVLLLTLSRLSHWLNLHAGGTDKKAEKMLKAEVTWWLMEDAQIVVAGFLNRAHELKLPLPRAGHVVLGSWLFVTFVVVNCLYSSQLTASLTIRTNRTPFNSMAELVQRHDFTWGIASGTAIKSVLERSQNEIYKKFCQGLQEFSKTDPEVLSTSQELHLNKTLRGKYAYLLGLEKYLWEWQSQYCHLKSVRVNALHKSCVFYLQKHSPYTKVLSDVINNMQETGVVKYLIRKWTPKKKFCGRKSKTPAISLHQTKTAFFLLGAGFILAAIAVSLEMWCANSHRADRKRLL